MPHSNIRDEVKKVEKEVDPEVLYYIKLINTIRNSKKQAEINEAFELVSKGLDTKIKKLAGRFRISGHSFEDIYQEALYALRFKAIKDYDETRGSGEGPAAFDRFALLCIRRHLSTTLKASNQNKHKILGCCKPLDHHDRNSDSEELSLVNIIPIAGDDIVTKIQSKEEFKMLVGKLLSRLSKFERQVFKLYAQQWTYEEIADKISETNAGTNDRSRKNAVKAIDNALSRIKGKGKTIVKRHLQKGTPEEQKDNIREFFGNDSKEV